VNTLPASLNKGDLIDAKDDRGKWCVAEIVNVDMEKNSIFIHYIGWADKWNEWIKMNDKNRIAKLV
jgi:hypothetical protein